jgi:hypothetical protein
MRKEDQACRWVAVGVTLFIVGLVWILAAPLTSAATRIAADMASARAEPAT